MKTKEVFVCGHKNPDTDSICSALACAYLKNQMAKMESEQGIDYMGLVDSESHYVPKRAGVINPETEYVLERFSMPVPGFIQDVRKQVKDINIRKYKGIASDFSLKKAWTIMKDFNTSTLPIVDDEDVLTGLITNDDISKAYMAVFDNAILSASKTSYKNIIDALNGEMIVGNIDSCVEEGKILIAAANVDRMKEHIDPHDMVILGNRYEAQLSAIEMNADCIIVCEGATVSKTIRKIAEDKGCKIISTPHDTYTVARLITQSVPVSYFMTRDNIISFRKKDFIEDIVATMTKYRHRDFPIVSKDNKFIGMISRRSLLNMPSKRMLMVDHNEVGQAVDGLHDAEVMEIVDHHKLGTVETIKPVNVRNQPLGCTATILYQMFMENGIDIPANVAGILCSAIISDTLLFRSPTCTPLDEETAKILAGIAGVDLDELANAMFTAGSNFGSKTDKEIFYADYKKFASGGVSFGVSQVLVMSADERKKVAKRLGSYVEEARKDNGVDMMFLVVTNIMDETSAILFAGENSRDIMEESFSGRIVDDVAMIIPGMVSRKKQFIPPIMAALQQ